MNDITMYSTETCPYCQRADQLLAAKGISIRKIRVDLSEQAFAEMQSKTGMRSVPQIFIGQRHIGGYSDLAALEQSGQLDGLLHA
ncbi:glutaredoxin 3 [Undibacterium squillarum]|uniref:Glutaredoxin n=1 Tax=Undibacterium squillarum TaxID=1131567 RepID=A0ABQ2XWT9_9BURK|nr:glutaredoxin 3 [Undibacterium squillarum]GGX36332.1 glutaredoxin [Undibacterium squillarum]